MATKKTTAAKKPAGKKKTTAAKKVGTTKKAGAQPVGAGALVAGDGPGAAPVFTREQVVDIVGALNAGAKTPSAAFETLVSLADEVSLQLDQLSDAAPISTIAALAAPFADALTELGIESSGWTVPQKITFVTQAVRLRRYARNARPEFVTFLAAIEQRTSQADPNAEGLPPIHW